MPQLTPTHWFSAFCPSSAMGAGSHASPETAAKARAVGEVVEEANRARAIGADIDVVDIVLLEQQTVSTVVGPQLETYRAGQYLAAGNVSRVFERLEEVLWLQLEVGLDDERLRNRDISGSDSLTGLYVDHARIQMHGVTDLLIRPKQRRLGVGLTRCFPRVVSPLCAKRLRTLHRPTCEIRRKELMKVLGEGGGEVRARVRKRPNLDTGPDSAGAIQPSQ